MASGACLLHPSIAAVSGSSLRDEPIEAVRQSFDRPCTADLRLPLRVRRHCLQGRTRRNVPSRSLPRACCQCACGSKPKSVSNRKWSSIEHETLSYCHTLSLLDGRRVCPGRHRPQHRSRAQLARRRGELGADHQDHATDDAAREQSRHRVSRSNSPPTRPGRTTRRPAGTVPFSTPSGPASGSRGCGTSRASSRCGGSGRRRARRS